MVRIYDGNDFLTLNINFISLYRNRENAQHNDRINSVKLDNSNAFHFRADT